MTNRIPPSLNWLIDKRARISGEIEKTRRSLKKAQLIIKELEELELKLRAIDTTLELHDIEVDVSLIAPILSNEIRIQIPHGELTKSILTCIRLYEKNGPVSRSMIERFVIQRHFDFDAKLLTPVQISTSIHNRLKNLFKQGLLERHHSPEKNKEGLWTLKQINFDNYK